MSNKQQLNSKSKSFVQDVELHRILDTGSLYPVGSEPYEYLKKKSKSESKILHERIRLLNIDLEHANFQIKNLEYENKTCRQAAMLYSKAFSDLHKGIKSGKYNTVSQIQVALDDAVKKMDESLDTRQF